MKRFEKTKGFLLGVVVCLLVSSMFTTAFGASVTKQLNAYYNNIKIMLNGTELIPKDGNGKVVEPFVVDGTTYLPVRAIAEALGLAVEWDGATQTVILGSNKKTGQPTIWLKDMPTLASEWGVNSNTDKRTVKDNAGNSYENYLYTTVNGDPVTYALNGQYSKFTGTAILQEKDKSASESFRLAVYLDDKLVYTSENITAGTFPIDFTVNTTGAVRMKVAFQYIIGDTVMDSSSGAVALVNAGLWK